MMSVYGDDSDEIEDEETLDLPPRDEPTQPEGEVLHYRWGGPFGQSEVTS